MAHWSTALVFMLACSDTPRDDKPNVITNPAPPTLTKSQELDRLSLDKAALERKISESNTAVAAAITKEQRDVAMLSLARMKKELDELDRRIKKLADEPD